jgi:hypothetical protein
MDKCDYSLTTCKFGKKRRKAAEISKLILQQK